MATCFVRPVPGFAFSTPLLRFDFHTVTLCNNDRDILEPVSEVPSPHRLLLLFRLRQPRQASLVSQASQSHIQFCQPASQSHPSIFLATQYPPACATLSKHKLEFKIAEFPHINAGLKYKNILVTMNTYYIDVLIWSSFSCIFWRVK